MRLSSCLESEASRGSNNDDLDYCLIAILAIIATVSLIAIWSIFR